MNESKDATPQTSVSETNALTVEVPSYPCSECGEQYVNEAAIVEGRCFKCRDPKRLAPVDERLIHAGMGKRELCATVGLIPEALKKAAERDSLVVEAVKALYAGTRPLHGFGFAGTAGTGKTFFMAALFKAYYEKSGASDLTWIPWPLFVQRRRMAVGAKSEQGFADMEAAIDFLADTPLLMLDDLAAERASGTYETDWLTSCLDVIVDFRHRNLLPTFYTTNISRSDFLDRYGSRLFSRLVHDNPFIETGGGKDLRGQR